MMREMIIIYMENGEMAHRVLIQKMNRMMNGTILMKHTEERKNRLGKI